MTHRRLLPAVLGLGLLVAPGCGTPDDERQPVPHVGKASAGDARAAAGPEDAAMQLTSSAFEHGGSIPGQYTCDGEDISPPLAWSGLPEGTKSLALIVDDPDAPDPANPKTTWVHWVLYNIPPTAAGLAEAVAFDDLPQGTQQGVNDWKRTGYGGPCPPVGRHRYYFKLTALGATLEGLHEPTKAELLQAMEGHTLAEARLMGTYEHPR